METKAKILIVDDEEGIRDMLSFSLKQQGYEIVTARDGYEGIEKVKKEKFDLAILDMKMPGMDGVTLLGKIKAVNPDMEVIIATGYGTIENVVESMKNGACDYINKPYTLEEVTIVVENALEKRKLKETVYLYEMSKVIFSTIKIDELLKLIADATIKILKADDVSLMLVDKEKRLYIAYSYGLDEQIKKDTRLSLGERVAGWAAEKNKPLILNGKLEDDPRFSGLDSREDIKSSIVFPLIGTSSVLGVLNANRTKNTDIFLENDLHKVSIFASMVTLAIENANLYQLVQETQSQLIQSEKMAVVGQLAGGVAHELNNPLSIILGLVQLILPSADQKSQLHSDLKEIEDASLRCKKIVSSLLAFSRRENVDFKLININEVVERALSFSSRQVEFRDIRVIKNLAEDLPKIFADSQKLEQVFLNLIVNAHDAMPRGGQLTVATRLVEKSNMPPEIYAEISDTGEGIPAENIEKLFIPFFTTKPVGVGSGLGLSICKGIIEKHSGNIEVKSETGKGATFAVIFPVKK